MLRSLAFLPFLCLALFGQGTTSRILGTVTDPSGAAIAGAKVKVRNEATGVSFESSTLDTGGYLFEAVQIGLYTVEVEASGFKKFVTRNNQLTVGTPMVVNAALAVGAVTDAVEVSAAAELVQTSQSGNIGPVVNERTMKEMPIVATRRRDPTSILTVTPGMNSGSNTGSGGHMNGARDRAWNFTLDGIDMNEVSAGGGVGNNPIRVNPDSVAEMKIVTSNASAEFGRNSGGQVALVTRSGGNEIHGNAFWFYRTPRLNANPWQNNFNRIGKEQFVQNIYGGSVGGPIKKNRTFYFANWQELRAIRNVTSQATVLTQQARQGIFRFVPGARNLPAGVVGASVDQSGNPINPGAIQTYNIVNSDPARLGLDPTVKAQIDQTPLPNRFDAGDGLNTAGFVFRPTETEAQRDLTGKIDHVINDRNTVFGRIYWGFQNTLCDGVNGGLPRVPGAPCLVDTKRSPRNYAFNWRSNLTPRVTNEFVSGWSEFFFNFPNPVQDLNRPSLSSAYTIPEAYTFGNARKLNTLQFVDNLSWFKGNHSFKAGVNFRLTQHLDTRGSIGGLNSALTVDFDRSLNVVDPTVWGLPAALNQQFDRPGLETMINTLLGRVGRIQQGFVAQGDQFVRGTFDFDARFYEYDFYFQDTWKVRKNLTIDYGIRLDARMAPTSAGSTPILAPTFVPVAGAAPSNTLTWQPGKLWNNDWNNWGPSIGFAWDPFGSGKTSIRGNYRMAYDRVPTFLISSFILPNMPGSTLGVTNQTFGAGGGRLRNLPALTPTQRPQELRTPIPFSANSNTVVDPNIETPQTNMWSFGIQREIAKRTVIEVNYIGRRAHNLLGGYDANQAFIRNGFLDAFRTTAAGGQAPYFDRLFSADSRRQANETGSAFVRRLFGPTLALNDVGTFAQTIARQPQSGTSLPNASGLGPFALYPYPQFAGGMNVIDSNDFSTFHSLQVNFTRQFARGATVNANYVWAKSLDTRSFDPAFTLAAVGNAQSASSTPFDINNRRLNYAPSDFDRRHSFFSNFVYELPFGKGQRFGGASGPWMNRLIGGWQVSGLFRAVTGRPFTVYSGARTFNSVVQSMANCTGCANQGMVRDEAGFKWFFDPTERGRFTAPGAGDFGAPARNAFYGPRFLNFDASFAKKLYLTERFTLELRADCSNLTNTPSFNGPTATFTSGTFGRIGADVASGPRQIMLGTKLNF